MYELGENISSRCEFFLLACFLAVSRFLVVAPAFRERNSPNIPFDLKTKQTLTDKILSKFGEGTFGRVLECWDRLERDYVAVKVRTKRGGEQERARDGDGGSGGDDKTIRFPPLVVPFSRPSHARNATLRVGKGARLKGMAREPVNGDDN